MRSRPYTNIIQPYWYAADQGRCQNLCLLRPPTCVALLLATRTEIRLDCASLQRPRHSQHDATSLSNTVHGVFWTDRKLSLLVVRFLPPTQENRGQFCQPEKRQFTCPIHRLPRHHFEGSVVQIPVIGIQKVILATDPLGYSNIYLLAHQTQTSN